ncbi:MAG: hypothetical protein ACK4S4_15615 [Pyrinomonadaceae bacterium]
MTNKKYRVTWREVRGYSVTVTAGSREDAIEKSYWVDRDTVTYEHVERLSDEDDAEEIKDA